MAESELALCLDLCRQARRLEGDARAEVLAKLEALLQVAAGASADLQDPDADATETALAQGPLITMDLTGYVTGWNQGAAELFGYTAQEAMGQHVLFLYADGDDEVQELFLERGASLMEVRRRKKSGEVFRAGLTLVLQEDTEGNPLALCARLMPLAERLSAEDKLRLHARIIEDSDQGILITDANEHIVSINAAFTRITGYTSAEAIGQTPDLLRSGKHDADFRAQVRAAMHGAGPWLGEILGRRKNGAVFPQSVAISAVRNDEGHITHAFSIFSDISAYKETEARLQRLANFDSVTGLPNRSLLNQLLGQALVAAQRSNGHGTLLVLGLHRLTTIYDSLGHDVGDELLVAVSRGFREVLRDEDVLARISADRFVVALFNIQKREHAGLVAQKLLGTLEQAIVIGPNALKLDASIGISVYPDDSQDASALIRFADVAMARAQEHGEAGYLFYSAEMNQRANEHFKLETELRRALVRGELLLHYQPKVSLRSGRIVGAEALVRWQHPELGMVPPGKFIPVAEETGLILDVGAWVLEEACRQIRQWQDAKLAMPPVAVNFSARQFDQNLPRRMQAVLDRHGIGPQHLKLEITESLVVRGAENVIPIMNELVAMGLAMALDDFGTGYSSLAYLKKFPITTLKIDRSFVVGIPVEENDCAIAQAIVTMGKQLRQEIVAEGVETTEQMRFLRDLGCDQLQGYLFSPPVTAEAFEKLVSGGARLKLAQ
ncbi:MAG TPA: EAL domain-containing protein [Burkholderiaceae bacterium]|nr:EAL domain-containing protein [Burkholderiaceae bacterium]